ncbi:hypothetical protein H0H81_005615 [Sphagnurus paluster]|uniref:Prolyl 4-hydroxylase alpha subunit domain-containing protein n=1 Tax=Sphagnurus paluster TaxID=117069 RepID=A0A9P7GKF5_9AGAR|nr:hypothetical protein H0H81_005615 [Sphagnurus paluster]
MTSPNLEKEDVTVNFIEFSKTPLAGSYSGFYAKIIDGLFTSDDCARLLTLASTSADSSSLWQPAGLTMRDGVQTVHRDFRNSDRALVIDDVHAAWIYKKLRPYVEDLHEIAPDANWGGITGRPGRKQGSTWVLDGVNPRLSFLRYGTGHYFKQHCDGLNEIGDKKSFVTLHIYLNSAAPPPASSVQHPSGTEALPSSNQIRTAENDLSLKLESELETQNGLNSNTDIDRGPTLQGGATRFWAPDKKTHLDIHPHAGRVLIFQQRMLVHSGEEVTQGIKYTIRSDFMFAKK